MRWVEKGGGVCRKVRDVLRGRVGEEGCGEEEGSVGVGMYLGGWFCFWLGWDLWMVSLGERWLC